MERMVERFQVGLNADNLGWGSWSLYMFWVCLSILHVKILCLTQVANNGCIAAVKE